MNSPDSVEQSVADDRDLGRSESDSRRARGDLIGPTGDHRDGRRGVERPRVFPVLWRGLTKRCPACGHRPIFARWNELERCCDGCGRDFERAGGDIWGFMYLGTGLFTGLFIFVLYRIYVPETMAGQLAMAGVAIVPMIASLPRRKGLALALDYLIRSHSGEEGRG